MSSNNIKCNTTLNAKNSVVATEVQQELDLELDSELDSGSASSL
jgi:hypothetical protein